MRNTLLFLIIGCLGFNRLQAQMYFSLSTDISFLRNLNTHEHFWAVGQNVLGNFHFSQKDGAYASLSYYTTGKFKNNGMATAIRAATNPQQLTYTLYSNLRYRQISLGWRHYIKGSFDSENTWNLYSIAGFGLLLAKAGNTYSPAVDTAKYTLPVYITSGTGNFKRLTLDLGLGAEFPLGTSIYFYTELRSWLPASGYPSPYLFNNKNVPLTLAVNSGIRVLVD